MESPNKKEFHTRTIKLKLRLVYETVDEKNAYWRRIRQITGDAWRATNRIASGQYLNDQMIRRLYARKKINHKNLDAVQAVEEEFRQFFSINRQTTTEPDIQDKLPDPSSSFLKIKS